MVSAALTLEAMLESLSVPARRYSTEGKIFHLKIPRGLTAARGIFYIPIVAEYRSRPRSTGLSGDERLNRPAERGSLWCTDGVLIHGVDSRDDGQQLDAVRYCFVE